MYPSAVGPFASLLAVAAVAAAAIQNGTQTESPELRVSQSQPLVAGNRNNNSATVTSFRKLRLPVPVQNITEDNSPMNSSTHIEAPPQSIVVRPAGPNVEEVNVNLPHRPARVPGAVTFPYEGVQAADDRVDNALTRAGSWDNMYSGCGVSKNCVGIPAGCEDTETCLTFVTIFLSNGTYHFQMRASDMNYVAVGLGRSRMMNAASVIECVKLSNDSVRAYLSWNADDEKSNERMLPFHQSAITLVDYRAMDGGLWCDVTRVNSTFMNDQSFDLNKDSFHILLASGVTVFADGIGGHTKRIGTANSRKLSEFGSFSAASEWPLRLHGALMVLAWVFSATVGMLAARYYRAAWGKETLCGKAIWFVWHRLLMILALVLNVAGAIAILAYVGGWSDSSGLHGIFGGITTGLAVVQMLGGFLRPDPSSNLRPAFNWFHRLLGLSSHLLAVITIFLSVSLAAASVPLYLYAILTVWFVFYLAMHALHMLTEIKRYYFLIVVYGSAVFTIAILAVVIVAPGSGT